MNSNRVQNGTPIHHDLSLCETCSCSIIIQGLAESQLVTKCGAISGSPTIKMHVVKCNKYCDHRQPSLYDMNQISWKIATDKSGKTVGFMSPIDFKRRAEKEDLREAGSPYKEEDY